VVCAARDPSTFGSFIPALVGDKDFSSLTPAFAGDEDLFDGDDSLRRGSKRRRMFKEVFSGCCVG